MAAALAGDPDMPLALGNPEHGVTLGALEEAIEILLALFLPAAGTQLGQWGNQGEIPLIFGPAAGSIAAENSEIAENQTNQRQQPEYGAYGAPGKHGDDQQHTGGKTGGHGKGVGAVSSCEKWLSPSHIPHLPF